MERVFLKGPQVIIKKKAAANSVAAFLFLVLTLMLTTTTSCGIKGKPLPPLSMKPKAIETNSNEKKQIKKQNEN